MCRQRVMGLVAGLGAMAPGIGVMAQVVPAVPAKPTPIPEWTPPAPAPAAAPTPPPPPAEPDLPPPDLVKRDSAGKFVPLAEPLDEAAVMALVPTVKSEEAREKISKAVEDRRARSEQAVARNAAAALEVRKQMAGLDAVSGNANINGINTQIRAMLISPNLIDTLMTSGGLTPKEVGRARKAVEAYRKALNNDAKEAVGGDATKMIEPLMKANLRLNWVEPSRTLEGLLERLSGRWAEVRGTLGLTDEQSKKIAALEKALAGAGTPAAKADALAAVLGELSGQQASVALKSVAREPAEPPAPEEKKGEEHGGGNPTGGGAAATKTPGAGAGGGGAGSGKKPMPPSKPGK